MADFINATPHVQQTSSGALVSPQEKASLDPKDAHDAALIEDEAFIPAKLEKEGR